MFRGYFNLWKLSPKNSLERFLGYLDCRGLGIAKVSANTEIRSPQCCKLEGNMHARARANVDTWIANSPASYTLRIFWGKKRPWKLFFLRFSLFFEFFASKTNLLKVPNMTFSLSKIASKKPQKITWQGYFFFLIDKVKITSRGYLLFFASKDALGSKHNSKIVVLCICICHEI